MPTIYIGASVLLFILLFVSLPLAVIYGKVKQISITLEEINSKMVPIPKNQSEIKSEEAETNGKYYPTA